MKYDLNKDNYYDCSDDNFNNKLNDDDDNSYYLDLRNDIYLTFNTIDECGKNCKYYECKPMEDMGFLYFKSINDSKIEMLIQVCVDFDTHKSYISRKKMIFKCKKLTGSLGCIDFNNYINYFTERICCVYINYCS